MVAKEETPEVAAFLASGGNIEHCPEDATTPLVDKKGRAVAKKKAESRKAEKPKSELAKRRARIVFE